MSDLKPCPFCGTNPTHEHDGWVTCPGCRAEGPAIDYDWRYQVAMRRCKSAEAWNTRADLGISEGLRKRIRKAILPGLPSTSGTWTGETNQLLRDILAELERQG